MKTFLHSFRILAVLTVLTGIVYPLSVWSVGQVLFRTEAEGSLVRRDGKVVGSRLLAQKTEDPRYFQPRPSAGDYATVASGASNLAWTSAKLRTRVSSVPEAMPPEMATTSGSGLDPDASPEAIATQLKRVVKSRELTIQQIQQLKAWVENNTHGGMYSPQTVNILELNLALDEIDAKR